MSRFIILKSKNAESCLDNYLHKHGAHFTQALADFAIDHLLNYDKSGHKWSCKDVESALAKSGLKIDDNKYIPDIAYTANMYYADFYPHILKTPDECILAAHYMLSDPDGYDGMAFYRWLTDIKKRKIEIDWKLFI